MIIIIKYNKIIIHRFFKTYTHSNRNYKVLYIILVNNNVINIWDVKNTTEEIMYYTFIFPIRNYYVFEYIFYYYLYIYIKKKSSRYTMKSVSAWNEAIERSRWRNNRVHVESPPARGLFSCSWELARATYSRVVGAP